MSAHIAPHAVVASNTSGLAVNAMADALPDAVRPRFCGVHFFNPPRYMHLAELIACRGTDPAVIDGLETFLTSTLGKGVVHATDTPRSAEHTSELQSLMRISYAVFCLTKTRQPVRRRA